VAWSGSTDDYNGFVERHSLSFPQIDDTPGVVFDRFGLVSQPGVVVVGADGTTETLTGRADGEAIATAVDAVLG